MAERTDMIVAELQAMRAEFVIRFEERSDERFDAIDARLDRIQASLESAIAEMNERLGWKRQLLARLMS